MKVTHFALVFSLLLPSVAIAEIAVAQEAESDGGFSYDYPQIVEQLPALLDHLASDRAAAQREFEENRREFTEIAPDSEALDHLQYSGGWSIVGESPVLLSLGQGVYTYSGGAHGNTDFDALLWNKRQDRQLSLLDLFTDRYRALSLIDAQFCPALRAEQAERFGGEVDGLWSDCPVLHEQPVAPLGDHGTGNFTGFRVMIAPYIAGPYVMGEFEIDIAMTPELLALVKPEYREGFVVSGEQ